MLAATGWSNLNNTLEKGLGICYDLKDIVDYYNYTKIDEALAINNMVIENL